MLCAILIVLVLGVGPNLVTIYLRFYVVNSVCQKDGKTAVTTVVTFVDTEDRQNYVRESSENDEGTVRIDPETQRAALME